MIRSRLTVTGGWMLGIVLGLGIWAGGGAVAAEALKPVIAGAEGERAFADLARFYQDGKARPPVEQAIQDLELAEVAKRAAAGKYLLAILAQSLADESNGRGNWQRTPFWGGGSESDARQFRQSFAKKLAAEAKAPEILDAAIWLVQEDKLIENQKHGMTLICRIQSPRSADVFRTLLAPPHPSQAVLVPVLEEVGRRKIAPLTAEVRSLCSHYRTSVRSATGKAAKALGVRDLPAYRPEDAFTPWLDGQLKNIAQMVEGGVPKDAKWAKFTVTHPKHGQDGEDSVQSFQGWLLSDGKEQVEVLDSFGDRRRVPKSQMKVEPSTLREQAKTLLEIRKKSDEGGPETPQAALSRQGMLTGQFEPGFISLPEALTAAWLYERGEKKLAAELLFPRIEATEDDRWLGWAVRDLLGHAYHQEMLNAFSRARDYDRTIQLAKHLAQPIFDGYGYQDRAKKLAEQLAKRGDDFKGFRLPTLEQWKELKKKLTRPQQIEYLAVRLRLLNCFQWGQPGGVNYGDPQTAEPGGGWREKSAKPQEVINPYVTLCDMDIQIAELPALVPFLADENFMPTFSYWRDFHPSRTLHQVNWAAANVINGTAKRDLAQLEAFNRLDEEGRKKHLATILEWCHRNAGKTEKDLLLQSLAEVKDWRDFEKAAHLAVRRRLVEALPIVVGRFQDFPRQQGDLLEVCYRLDTEQAVPHARKWLASEDLDIRFWSALILLRHGDKAKLEGLAELEAALAKDDGSYLFPPAIDPLLATKNDKAAALASGILKKKRFELHGFSSGRILQRLFLAGRQECLDYLLTKLDSEAPGGSVSGTRDDKAVERSLVEGDRAAEIVADWQVGDSRFDSLAPDQERRTKRQELKTWLKEQFALVKAGKKPKMAILSGSIEPGRWQLDAP